MGFRLICLQTVRLPSPRTPLILLNEGHEAAKLVANAGTSQMGRIAAGLDSAVRVGRDNGLIPKRRWPWQR